MTRAAISVFSRLLLLVLALLSGLVGFASEDGSISPAPRWTAQWIWDNGEQNPTNYFLRVRKDFELSSRPDSAPLHITSADRYKLFVNGKYVGRGPARSDPR